MAGGRTPHHQDRGGERIVPHHALIHPSRANRLRGGQGAERPRQTQWERQVRPGAVHGSFDLGPEQCFDVVPRRVWGAPAPPFSAAVTIEQGRAGAFSVFLRIAGGRLRANCISTAQSTGRHDERCSRGENRRQFREKWFMMPAESCRRPPGEPGPAAARTSPAAPSPAYRGT
ncbi:MAG: hypothetical protein PWP08_987 [Methanofollis sp.]|nr:hypothetical protein [Methanofollis sp.]